MSYMHRVRIDRTVEIDNQSLRAFWAYHRDGEPFSIRKALTLFRDVVGNNPEIEIQIEEGLIRLEATRQDPEI